MSGWALAAIGLVLVGLVNAGFQLRSLITKQKIERLSGSPITSESESEPNRPSVTAEKLRLAEFGRQYLRLMEEDSHYIWQRIHANWAAVVADAHLGAVNPWIDLMIEFVNGTVFEVTPGRLEGGIQYNGDPLRDAPELIGIMKGNHAEGFRVTIRQWLLPETARHIQEKLPATLQTGKLALFFRYVDGKGETKELRYAFPDEIFKIAPTKGPIGSVATRLKLQFGSGDTLPIGIEQNNIWRWYALATVFKGLEPEAKTFNELARNWSVFLIFDQPTNFKQIRIDGSGARLPMYEIKDSSVRGSVIVFNGDLTSVVLDIELIL